MKYMTSPCIYEEREEREREREREREKAKKICNDSTMYARNILKLLGVANYLIASYIYLCPTIIH